MTGQRRPDEMIRILRAEFVTKSGGVGGPCVTFTCGATGWRGEGGTIPRTLVHETAFQLDTSGNARGAYSVDLQQNRGIAGEVVSGEYSFLHGIDSTVGADYSVGFGEDIQMQRFVANPAEYNFGHGLSIYMGDYTYTCFGSGIAIDIDSANAYSGGQYLVYAFGEGHDFDEANYVFVFGSDCDVIKDSFGIYAFGEQLDFEEVGADYPTYTGAFAAILCSQKGDVWTSLQVGEACEMETTTLRALQVGYQHYSAEIIGALQIGAETLAYDNDSLGLLNAQILLGDGVNDGFTADPWQGMNQSAWLSQAGWITTWNVAWTTEWQFPLRSDMVWYFKAIIVGTESGAANSYCWILEGLIENDGGTTTILAFTATNNYYRDVATKEWQIVVDDPNDRYALQFRDTAGPDATPCNLQLRMIMVEVGND